MNLTLPEKVAALRELVAGADDVFACHAVGGGETDTHWRPVYNRVSDALFADHLRGHVELGSYPLIPSDGWPRVQWVCADFDGKRPMTDWKADVQRLVPFLTDFDGCPVVVNTSRSAAGAHVRMLFKESVPAWMARRWFMSWLREAGVVQDDAWEQDVPSSFDRVIPPQDTLRNGVTDDGRRFPGNLAGNPLHGKHAKRGGTLPLDPRRVAVGDFEPDGEHWRHVLDALHARSWGEAELRAALADAPTPLDTEPPQGYRRVAGGDGVERVLPIVAGDVGRLQFFADFCAFAEHLARPGQQGYHLWVAMASQLHRYGDAGNALFHEISSRDPRYSAAETEQKWHDTTGMAPVRCDSLVAMGFSCPHLTSPRCNGAKSPTYFADWSYHTPIAAPEEEP